MFCLKQTTYLLYLWSFFICDASMDFFFYIYTACPYDRDRTGLGMILHAKVSRNERISLISFFFFIFLRLHFQLQNSSDSTNEISANSKVSWKWTMNRRILMSQEHVVFFGEVLNQTYNYVYENVYFILPFWLVSFIRGIILWSLASRSQGHPVYQSTFSFLFPMCSTRSVRKNFHLIFPV